MEINESNLDPIQPTLCKDIFIGPDYKVMKTKVKNQILDNFYKWLKKMGYDYEQVVQEIRLEGSSAGYQYTEVSDLDVSIISSIPDSEINKLWSILPNGEKLEGTQMDINYYLLRSDEHDTNEATPGIYDILNDKWLKEPSLENVKKRIPFSYIMEIVKFFTSGISNRLLELDSDKLELENLNKLTDAEIDKQEKEKLISLKETEIKADLDAIYVGYCMLKSLRHQAYAGAKKDDNGNEKIKSWYPIPLIMELKDTEKFDNPASSLSNLVYKGVEKTGVYNLMEKALQEREKYSK